MEIKFYDTKSRMKRRFLPKLPNDVRMYVCGPTVYDRAHIGNARPAVIFDILFRFLRHEFGENNVTYVRNFTDIDDKINEAAIESQRSIRDITNETIQFYRDDMATLNVLEPTFSPRATEYVPAMIRQIKSLVDTKNAYCEADGHVMFAVDSFTKYGELSRQNLDEIKAGSRVPINERKRNPMDFVLWKPSSGDLPGWESPWGRGRPGWHIECSAMIEELLGTEFDIHGGGIDLVFPHHENEIAQSSCVHPKGKFADFWMHNGFVTIEGEKMSKSANNFFTVKDLENEGLDGDTIRMVLMSTHYRQPLDWTSEKVQGVTNSLKRWRQSCIGKVKKTVVDRSILEALSDDLNTPLALTELHRLASNKDFSALLGSAQFLGLLSNFQDRESNKYIVDEHLKKKVEIFLAERFEYKKDRDFTNADHIRFKLENCGIKIEDLQNKSVWEILPTFDKRKLEDL
ncbi:MAG: cysteine--tRNA ligase [Pseudomonadota bacterium]|nr:cysteine--tRNA ligase [Pseudomonadota bacterium]